MTISRKQRVRELTVAERRMDAQWQQLRVHVEARVTRLRVAHPAWLIGGGFLSGFVAAGVFSAAVRSPLASNVLVHGMQLWALLPRRFLRGVFAGGSPAP